MEEQSGTKSFDCSFIMKCYKPNFSSYKIEVGMRMDYNRINRIVYRRIYYGRRIQRIRSGDRRNQSKD